MRTSVTNKRGNVNHGLHGLHRFFNQEFFFALSNTAKLFITLLLTGIAATNPCLNSISGGPDRSESATVEAINALAEENISLALTAEEYTSSSKGLRRTPDVSPTFFSEPIPTKKADLDRGAAREIAGSPRVIVGSEIPSSNYVARVRDGIQKTHRQCPRSDARIRDLASSTINAAYKYMRMCLYAVYEPPYGRCVWFFCEGEGLDRSPRPSFIFTTKARRA